MKEVVKEVRVKQGERRVKEVAPKTPLAACHGLLSLFHGHDARDGLHIYLSLLSLFHPLSARVCVCVCARGRVKEGKKVKEVSTRPEGPETPAPPTRNEDDVGRAKPSGSWTAVGRVSLARVATGGVVRIGDQRASSTPTWRVCGPRTASGRVGGERVERGRPGVGTTREKQDDRADSAVRRRAAVIAAPITED